jgi:hypothetical protein
VPYLAAFLVSLPFAAVVAIQAYGARGCDGPLPGLSLAVTGAVVLGLAVILGITAVVVAVFRRRPAAIYLGLIAAGLLCGWYLGLALAEPNDPCRSSGPPAVDGGWRDARAVFAIHLAAPYSLDLNGFGDCTVEADGTPLAHNYINGTATADDGTMVTLWGLPVDRAGGPFDTLDVTVTDGHQHSWGYRPTDWDQVTVGEHSLFRGTIRLVRLPLLEDPDGLPGPASISGTIAWGCNVETL